MKTMIGALAGLLLAGTAWVVPAQAQGWPGYNSYTTPAPAYSAPRYSEPRYNEPRYNEPRRELGSGSEMRERCGGLHREAEMLRHRLDREWNPVERARTEGRLREVREQAERCR
jgi:hypothetical protein